MTQNEWQNQWRLESVQLAGWGVYDEPRRIDIPREGTVIAGASGTGKTTVLDAINYTLDPKARGFNAAAGDTSSRSVVNYVVGRLDEHEPIRPSADGQMVRAATMVTFHNGLGERAHGVVITDVVDDEILATTMMLSTHPQPLSLAADILSNLGDTAAVKVPAKFEKVKTKGLYTERLAQRLGMSDDQALLSVLRLQKFDGTKTLPEWVREHVLRQPEALTGLSETVTSLRNAVDDLATMENTLRFDKEAKRLMEKYQAYQDQAAAAQVQIRLRDSQVDGLPGAVYAQNKDLLESLRHTADSQVQNHSQEAKRHRDLSAAFDTGDLGAVEAAYTDAVKAQKRRETAESRARAEARQDLLGVSPQDTAQTLQELVDALEDIDLLKEQVDAAAFAVGTARSASEECSRTLAALRATGRATIHQADNLAGILSEAIPAAVPMPAYNLVHVRSGVSAAQQKLLETVLRPEVLTSVYVDVAQQGDVQRLLDTGSAVGRVRFTDPQETLRGTPVDSLLNLLHFPEETPATVALRNDILEWESNILLTESGTLQYDHALRRYPEVRESQYVLNEDVTDIIALREEELQQFEAEHEQAQAIKNEAEAARDRHTRLTRAKQAWDELASEDAFPDIVYSWDMEALVAERKSDLERQRESNKEAAGEKQRHEKLATRAERNAGAAELVRSQLDEALGLSDGSSMELLLALQATNTQATPRTLADIQKQIPELEARARAISAVPFPPELRAAFSIFTKVNENSAILQDRLIALGLSSHMNNNAEAILAKGDILLAPATSEFLSELQTAILDKMEANLGFIDSSTNLGKNSVGKNVGQLNELLARAVYSEEDGVQTFVRLKTDPRKEAEVLLRNHREGVKGFRDLLKEIEESSGLVDNPDLRAKVRTAVSALLESLENETLADLLTDYRQALDVTFQICNADGEVVSVIRNTEVYSGGQNQRLRAFCCAASTFSRHTTETTLNMPNFGLILSDEAFGKADGKVGSEGLGAYFALNLQPVLFATVPSTRQWVADGTISEAIIISPPQPGTGSTPNINVMLPKEK